jgi:hypothetical protein
MRKKELVYIHDLLTELRGFYETTTGEPIPAPAYDEMDVNHTSIHIVHIRKNTHKAAVFALANAMTEKFEGVSDIPND